MATTIHGWPVLGGWGDVRLEKFRVPGAKRTMTLRHDVGPYLVAFAAEYHQKIRPIDVGNLDDWAYTAPRLGNASSKISDHSGGVAIDLNATQEGSQSRTYNKWWTKNPLKYLALKRLLKKYHLLEAGINYKNFWDPMHYTFKYGVTPYHVKSEIKRLGITL